MPAPSSSLVAAAANIHRRLVADPDRLAALVLAAVVALRVHVVAGLAAGLALTLGARLSRPPSVASAPVARVIDLSAARVRRARGADRPARPSRPPSTRALVAGRRLRLVASAESPS